MNNQTTKTSYQIKTSPVALIYCRVSTEKQEEKGTSLDSQAKACIEYAKANGYQIGEVIQEVFSGAYLFDRPKLNAQRAKIRAGAYDIVIAYAIDRLSRDVAHLSIIHDEITRHGALLDFVTEKLENTAEGKLMLSVRSFVAEVERAKIRERSMRGRMAKLEAGKLVANSCDLFGYTVDRKLGVRVIKENEAKIVERIYREFLQDKSLRAIVRDLNADEIPPPSFGKKNFKHEKFKTIRDYGVNVWGTAILTKMLKNQAYIGITFANQYGSRMEYVGGLRKVTRFIKPRSEWMELTGVTPAIVSEEVFNAVQNRNTSKAAAFTRNEKRPILLRGLIFCSCGRTLCPEFTKGRKPGQEFLYYRCASRGKTQCPNYVGSISGAKLDLAAWGKVETLFTKPETIKLEIEQRLDNADNERATIEADLLAIKSTLVKTEGEVKKLTERIAFVDDSVFDIVNKQITEKSKEVTKLKSLFLENQNRLASLDNDLAGLVTLQDYAETFKQKLANASFEDRRLLCEALGVKIVVNNKTQLSITMSIPTENEVISIVSNNQNEDLRCNSTDKFNTTKLPRRPENRNNTSKINSFGRCVKLNNDSVFSTHGNYGIDTIPKQNLAFTFSVTL